MITFQLNPNNASDESKVIIKTHDNCIEIQWYDCKGHVSNCMHLVDGLEKLHRIRTAVDIAIEEFKELTK